jgi:hypothetical protein
MMTTENEHPADTLRRLQAEISASPGWAALTRIRRLRRTLAILLANSGDLRAALDFFADPTRSLALWSIERRAEFDQFLGEIDRLLHNFLAAAKTLVDHTRRIMNEAYDGSDLMTQYSAEVERLFSDGPPTFVQDLRNYFLHYDLARSTGRMHQSRTHTSPRFFWTRTGCESGTAGRPPRGSGCSSNPINSIYVLTSTTTRHASASCMHGSSRRFAQSTQGRSRQPRRS